MAKKTYRFFDNRKLALAIAFGPRENAKIEHRKVIKNEKTFGYVMPGLLIKAKDGQFAEKVRHDDVEGSPVLYIIATKEGVFNKQGMMFEFDLLSFKAARSCGPLYVVIYMKDTKTTYLTHILNFEEIARGRNRIFKMCASLEKFKAFLESDKWKIERFEFAPREVSRLDILF